jgi:hypothetical protein
MIQLIEWLDSDNKGPQEVKICVLFKIPLSLITSSIYSAFLLHNTKID